MCCYREANYFNYAVITIITQDSKKNKSNRNNNIASLNMQPAPPRLSKKHLAILRRSVSFKQVYMFIVVRVIRVVFVLQLLELVRFVLVQEDKDFVSSILLGLTAF